MSAKMIRPKQTMSVTIKEITGCGEIFVTTTFVDKKPFEVFICFGKAGGCGSAVTDGVAKLISYGLRSGMDHADAIKALTGIGCHLGPNTCMAAVASSIEEAVREMGGV